MIGTGDVRSGGDGDFVLMVNRDIGFEHFQALRIGQKKYILKFL